MKHLLSYLKTSLSEQGYLRFWQLEPLAPLQGLHQGQGVGPGPGPLLQEALIVCHCLHLGQGNVTTPAPGVISVVTF